THTVDFGLANGFQVILERNDCGNNVERFYSRLKTRDFTVDNDFGKFGFLLTVGNMRCHRLLKVVNVVEEDAVQFVHLRVNVAGHGYVDEEHGAVFATAEKKFSVLTAENGTRSTSRGDYDIGVVTGVVEFIEMDSLSAETLRQSCGSIISAISNEDGSRSVGQQMPRCQLAHLARPD